eukprot:gb/GECG01008762.1/.p1 GENE.gb/GECG01008762.1/~~gb/GECG01008762.1/.p1  ORF type:complete len:312 (+),score=9.47 gb/GECG01008762.1/:1-936(+)
MKIIRSVLGAGLLIGGLAAVANASCDSGTIELISMSPANCHPGCDGSCAQAYQLTISGDTGTFVPVGASACTCYTFQVDYDSASKRLNWELNGENAQGFADGEQVRMDFYSGSCTLKYIVTDGCVLGVSQATATPSATCSPSPTVSSSVTPSGSPTTSLSPLASSTFSSSASPSVLPIATPQILINNKKSGEAAVLPCGKQGIDVTVLSDRKFNAVSINVGTVVIGTYPFLGTNTTRGRVTGMKMRDVNGDLETDAILRWIGPVGMSIYNETVVLLITGLTDQDLQFEGAVEVRVVGNQFRQRELEIAERL